MTTKARATTTEGQPLDGLAAGDALQARRLATARDAARAAVAEPMAAFTVLEPIHAQVAPLGADLARWQRDYRRTWVRAEPGLANEFLWLDSAVESGIVAIGQFPELVARARAFYAAMTVENAAYAERTIRNLLRSAESIQRVAEHHRAAQAHVETIQKTLDRRIAAGTLQPPASPGVAPATSGAPPSGPRHARSAIGNGDDE